jgi:signal transduction histidine kinase
MRLINLIAALAVLPGMAVSVSPVVAAPAVQPSGSAPQAGSQFDALIADARAAMLLDPPKAIERGRAAERMAGQLTGRARMIGMATAQWLQGEAYLRINDAARAGPLIDRAIKIVAKAGPPTKLSGDLLLSRGGLHTATANVAAALDDYQQAHNIYRDIGNVRSRAIALLTIAMLYQEAEDYQNALKYYDQALDVYRADSQISYAIYNNRANALRELGRLSQAEGQFRKALELARELKSPAMEARVLSNIARGQLAAGQLGAADRTISQGFAVAQDAGAASAREQFWVLAAHSALLKGDLPKAIKLITRSFSGVDPENTTLELREGHKIAYEIFRKAGDDPQALVHLEALKRLDDQTSKLAASANTSLVAARFDFANQKTRIAQLKATELQRNIDFERMQARTRQNIAIGLSVVVVIIVGMLAFGIVTLRRSRNQVRAANIDLAATNDALGKALAAKTEFLATTSHEIRTPLNGILGMTQVMLADRTLTDQVRDRIGVVHGAGVTMRALVDDILDVAKMETGNMTIEQVPFDLKATLRDVARLWQEQAAGKGVGFVLDLDQSPEWIEGDAARLRQIAFNLLSNALKFTEKGSVSLSAATVAGRLRLIVRDSGIGVPAEKYDLIFESFRQVDAGTTRRFGGTGLGLSICRNLARAMGGDVRVESEMGVGSCFIIDLPLVPATAPEAIAEMATGKALLIVDRSPITRSMLRAMLEQQAGVVMFAASAEEAVEKIAVGQVAQVLIDDLTIKASGDRDAALSSIAAAAGANVRTSLLWAAPDDSEHAALCGTGITQVIAKPVSAAELIEKLYIFDSVLPKHLVSRAA